MATWRDGPEYAPTERPDSFEAADILSLSPSSPTVPLEQSEISGEERAPQITDVDAPLEQPNFFPAQDDLRPLSEYGPPKCETRDATTPFEMVAALMTSPATPTLELVNNAPNAEPSKPLADIGHRGSGFDPKAPMSITARTNASGQLLLHDPPALYVSDQYADTQEVMPSWQPPMYPPTDTRAYEVVPGMPGMPGNVPTPGFPSYGAPPQGFPAPGTPGWFGPDNTYRPQQPKKVDFQKVCRTTTPGVLITTFIGATIMPFALLMLILSFLLSSRIRYRRQQIQISYLIGTAVTAICGLWSSITFGFDIDWTIEAMNEGALWVCRLIIWVIPFIVYRALVNHERPS